LPEKRASKRKQVSEEEEWEKVECSFFVDSISGRKLESAPRAERSHFSQDKETARIK
jgi:hypothetical protein